VLFGAAAFTFSVSVAGATPQPMPHANPADVPPSTVVGHGLPVPLAVLGVLALLLSAYIAVALARRRTA
jgi:hypothetical protein